MTDPETACARVSTKRYRRRSKKSISERERERERERGIRTMWRVNIAIVRPASEKAPILAERYQQKAETESKRARRTE